MEPWKKIFLFNVSIKIREKANRLRLGLFTLPSCERDLCTSVSSGFWFRVSSETNRLGETAETYDFREKFGGKALR